MQMTGMVQDPLVVFGQSRGQLVPEFFHQLSDLGSIKGEGCQPSGQTFGEREIAGHAEVGETFNFRHFGGTVWIIRQDQTGQGIQALNRT